MRLALFEPDIPQNAGTMLRMAACFGLAVDIIEPCGFLLGDRAFRRAGLDYLDQLDLHRHASWAAFLAAHGNETTRQRLVLLTTHAKRLHTNVRYEPTDVLLVGRESAGVPEAVHGAADLRVRVPLRPSVRSLNVAVAAAIVVGEALRQTKGFPAV